MKLLKKEFIYGGHLLSIGASCIVWTVSLLLSEVPSWQILLLAYLSSQIVYNYDHLDDIGKKTSNSSRAKYLNQTKYFQFSMMGTYLIVFTIVSFMTTVQSAVLALLIVIGGILYTSKLKKQMKKVTGLKNVYIAAFWTALSFFLYEQTTSFFFVSLFIFVRWIINSSFFDIKDIKSDKQAGIATLPVKLGLKKTINYLHIANFISGGIILSGVYMKFLDIYALSLLFFVIYSFYYLSKAGKVSNKGLLSISYILVDGEYLFWPFVLILGKLIV